MTWGELREQTAMLIGEEHEVRILLEEVGAMSAGEMLCRLDEPVSDLARARLAELVTRRSSGEPLQHVLGHWPFRNVELTVDRRALVPRPETELVVEIALHELDRQAGDPAGTLAIDLGTGSGAIACALVEEVPGLEVFAVDIDTDALDLATINRSHLALEKQRRLTLCQGNFYEALPPSMLGRASLVVSNPPYIASEDWQTLPEVVRDFDPRVALIAGPSGLEAIAAVIAGAPRFLCSGGSLVVEISPEQSGPARALASTAGAIEIDVRPDLVGRDRALVARF